MEEESPQNYASKRTLFLTELAKLKLLIYCYSGNRKTSTLLHCGWEYKFVQLLSRAIWQYLGKLKISISSMRYFITRNLFYVKVYTHAQTHEDSRTYTMSLFRLANRWETSQVTPLNRRQVYGTSTHANALWMPMRMLQVSFLSEQEFQGLQEPPPPSSKTHCPFQSLHSSTLAFSWILTKRYMHPKVHSSIIYNIQAPKQPTCLSR